MLPEKLNVEKVALDELRDGDVVLNGDGTVGVVVKPFDFSAPAVATRGATMAWPIEGKHALRVPDGD